MQANSTRPFGEAATQLPHNPMHKHALLLEVLLHFLDLHALDLPSATQAPAPTIECVGNSPQCKH
eukprot:1688789-Amphidinium_carterae.1